MPERQIKQTVEVITIDREEWGRRTLPLAGINAEILLVDAVLQIEKIARAGEKERENMTYKTKTITEDEGEQAQNHGWLGRTAGGTWTIP